MDPCRCLLGREIAKALPEPQMPVLNSSAVASPHGQGFERIVSEASPAHYMVKMESFSELKTTSLEKYESNAFPAGGYKWKLIIYPNGKKSKNNDYISMYLAMADTESLPRGWEVYAVFRFFCLDQYRDNYLRVQVEERRFHGMKLEWGIDEFLPLEIFDDVRKGYNLDDTCVFGAEVFVTRERSFLNGENLLMVKNPLTYNHVWEIEDFSKLDKEFYDSKPFQAGNKEWFIRFYPKGKDAGSEKYVSLYLALAPTESLSPGTKIYASFELRILDQFQSSKHYFRKGNYWFSASSKISAGWWAFLPRSSFSVPKRYIFNDTCFVEAEVSVLGVASAIP